jgi:hypothetical protein
MARIRSVKPELRTSLTVATWPREVRYAWVLLWGYLDDHGRGKDDMRLLLADLFPLDKDVTSKKLDRWLELMCQPGPGDPVPALCRYVVAGQTYLHATKWGDHQKVSHPKSSRIPSCPINHAATEAFTKPSGNPPEDFQNRSVPRVRADQGREGKGTGRGRAPEGAPTNDDRNEPALIEVINAAVVVGEWVAAFSAPTDRQPPSGSMRAQAGREAKKLLEGGANPQVVLEAARRAGGKGFATIEREYAPLIRPTNGGHNPRLSPFVEQ